MMHKGLQNTSTTGNTKKIATALHEFNSNTKGNN